MPLRGLPDIPGVVARPMSLGHADGVAVAALVDEESRLGGKPTVSDPDEMVQDLGFIEHLDPSRDTLILEVSSDGGSSIPVAYAVVRSFRESPGPRVLRHMVKVHPQYLRRGIGTAVLGWCRARLDEMAAQVIPTDPAATPVVYRTTIGYDTPGGLALMEREKYEPVAYWGEMERPLDDLPSGGLPDGVELRPVDESQLRTIWEAEAEASRDHWGYIEPTDAHFREFLEFPHTDHSLWTVAWHQDEVVGQIRAFINHQENRELGLKVGWTEWISTARPWRRRGIAGAMLCESMRRLADRGMDTARLGVHTDNPNGAFRLYENHGFVQTARSTEFEKAVPAR